MEKWQTEYLKQQKQNKLKSGLGYLIMFLIIIFIALFLGRYTEKENKKYSVYPNKLTITDSQTLRLIRIENKLDKLHEAVAINGFWPADLKWEENNNADTPKNQKNKR